VEASDEFHRGEIEFAPIIGAEDNAEVIGVVHVEFLLRQAGEERADDVIDLRGHADSVFDGNGCCRRLRVGARAGSQGGGQEKDGGQKTFYGHGLSFSFKALSREGGTRMVV